MITDWSNKFKTKRSKSEIIIKPYYTRIAPSPTGHAHIGTFRTALFNYLAAKASGGRFHLRIDDTDTERNQEEAIAPIYDALHWLGMEYEELPRQSARIRYHQEKVQDLYRAGLCTTLDNGAIALKWHPEMPATWIDNIAGEMKVTPTNIEQIDGKLILLKGKEGGFAPTYQLASTVDDWNYGINYIIRGTDHIANTPKQLAIWWALNKHYYEFTSDFKQYPEFAHIGLIFKDGKKLSKRDGASSLLDYAKNGYTKESLLTLMLRLGWSPEPDTNTDIWDLYNMQENFLQGRMKNTSANFDIDKLNSLDVSWKKGYKKMGIGYREYKPYVRPMYENVDEVGAVIPAAPRLHRNGGIQGQIAEEMNMAPPPQHALVPGRLIYNRNPMYIGNLGQVGQNPPAIREIWGNLEAIPVAPIAAEPDDIFDLHVEFE